MRTVRVRTHWRQGMPVKGYVRRHNYVATVKGSPEFKREVEKQKDLFEGPIPVNIREEGYVRAGYLGQAVDPRFFRTRDPFTGINVDVATSVPDWKSILVHEGVHVRERQKGISYDWGEEERANLEAIRRVPSEAKYKSREGSRTHYPPDIFRKPSQFTRRWMAERARRIEAEEGMYGMKNVHTIPPTMADLERLHTKVDIRRSKPFLIVVGDGFPPKLLKGRFKRRTFKGDLLKKMKRIT